MSTPCDLCQYPDGDVLGLYHPGSGRTGMLARVCCSCASLMTAGGRFAPAIVPGSQPPPPLPSDLPPTPRIRILLQSLRDTLHEGRPRREVERLLAELRQ